MSAQYGVDIGCDSTDAAMAWAWKNWARLRWMTNPAVPIPLQLDVTIAQRDGVAGVTAIAASTTFKVTNTGAAPSLQLLSGVPASTARVAVRFKKGDDVWELTADPTLGTAIALTVPGGETDKFASDPVDWVLFTLIDANERIVGAGGALI